RRGDRIPLPCTRQGPKRAVFDLLRPVPPGGAPPGPVPVVAGPALLGLDLEHEPLDGDDPDLVAGAGGLRPFRRAPPPGPRDAPPPARCDAPPAPALLPAHPLAPDGRCGETRPPHRRHRAEHEQRRPDDDDGEYPPRRVEARVAAVQ